MGAPAGAHYEAVGQQGGRSGVGALDWGPLVATSSSWCPLVAPLNDGGLRGSPAAVLEVISARRGAQMNRAKRGAVSFASGISTRRFLCTVSFLVLVPPLWSPSSSESFVSMLFSFFFGFATACVI